MLRRPGASATARSSSTRSSRRSASGPANLETTRSRRLGHPRHNETADLQGKYMTTASDILKKIKDEDIKYVDLRFTDPRGKLQHVTMDVSVVDEDLFEDGTMFD